jgi:nucleoid-associated protein YgaU
MQVQRELDGWPPKVQLEWGNLQRGWNFPFYITNMTQKFLLFTPNGTPVRATVDITGKSDYDGALGPQNPSSGGEGDERVRLVQPGERLDLIAYQEYGDASLWRYIASANGLSGLRDLRVGQRLAIPPIS